MFQMKRLQIGLSALVFVALGAGATSAQSLDYGTPQIMAPEPGTRLPARVRPRAADLPAQRGDAPIRRARGSSSPSPVPQYRSPPDLDLTPPRTPKAPTLTQAPPVPRPVPGFNNVLPPPTSLSGSGQTFQDRAIGCSHYGASQGVGAGQIGAYTGGCVNTR
jgi:hypothetical protein